MANAFAKVSAEALELAAQPYTGTTTRDVELVRILVKHCADAGVKREDVFVASKALALLSIKNASDASYNLQWSLEEGGGELMRDWSNPVLRTSNHEKWRDDFPQFSWRWAVIGQRPMTKIWFDAFRKHLTGINQLGDDLPADLFKPIKEFPLTKMLARLREPGIEEWEMVSRIFMCSCRSWLGSPDDAVMIEESGDVDALANEILNMSHEALLTRSAVRDRFGLIGLKLSAFTKVMTKLPHHLHAKVIDKRMTRHLLSTLEMVEDVPASTLNELAAVFVALLVLGVSSNPTGRENLRECGAVNRLRHLRDSAISEAVDNGRSLGMLVTITSANLIGRSEDTTEGLTVNQLNRVVTHLLVVINTQRKSGQLTHLYELVTAVREITVSGRHLKMMVEAGILKAFAIVAGENFKKILAFLGTAITAGKTMEVHAWEMVAFVGLHTALSENGKQVLQADPEAVEALKMLVAIEGRADLDQAIHDAKLALLQLSLSTTGVLPGLDTARRGGEAAAAAAVADGAAATQHVMISYSWEQQPVVLRFAECLKSRGFKIWIDVEHMTGSTVDAMADAVENASVVCICMSKSYKESTNCRFEANYVTLQHVPYICLMMEDGYQPKGWLGIMLGMNLWHGFYGDVLASDAAFEAKAAVVVTHLQRHMEPAQMLPLHAPQLQARLDSVGLRSSSHAPASTFTPHKYLTPAPAPAPPTPPPPAATSAVSATGEGALSERVRPAREEDRWPAQGQQVRDLDKKEKLLWSRLKASLENLAELKEAGLIDADTYKSESAVYLKLHRAQSERLQLHQSYIDGVISGQHLKSSITALLPHV